MYRVVFTRRIKIIISLVAFLLAGVFVGLYFTIIAPKAKEIKTVQEDFEQVQADILKGRDSLAVLKESKGLLESEAVKGIPAKSEIVAFLKDFSDTLGDNQSRVGEISLEEDLEYVNEDDPTTVLKHGQFTIALTSEKKANLFNMVEALDNRPRYVNYRSFIYQGRSKYDPPSPEEILEGSIYQMDVDFDVYYLDIVEETVEPEAADEKEDEETDAEK